MTAIQFHLFMGSCWQECFQTDVQVELCLLGIPFENPERLCIRRGQCYQRIWRNSSILYINCTCHPARAGLFFWETCKQKMFNQTLLFADVEMCFLNLWRLHVLLDNLGYSSSLQAGGCGWMMTIGQETMVFPSGPECGPCRFAVFYLLTSASSRNKNFTAKGPIRNEGSFVVER